MQANKSMAEFLDEVPSETMQQLLNSVHCETFSIGSTGFTLLDHHITGQSTDLDEEGRASVEMDSLHRGDVLEVQGLSSSGKTHLLYHLAINCILPQYYEAVALGGWDKVAVVFDTEGKWSSGRCHELMASRLQALLPFDTDCSTLAATLSRNIFIFRPTSTIQFAISLAALPQFLQTNSPKHELGVLIVDSMSAFYWQDRFSVEQQCSAKVAGPVNPLQYILPELQSLRLSHGPIIAFANWGLTLASSSKNSSIDTAGPLPFFRQHLYPFPSPFQDPAAGHSLLEDTFPVTHHITLYVPPPPLLQPHLTLRAAQNKQGSDAQARSTAVYGVVRTISNGQVGRFSFAIGSTAIDAFA